MELTQTQIKYTRIAAIVLAVIGVLLLLWYYLYPDPTKGNRTAYEVKNNVPAGSADTVAKKADAKGILAGVLSILTGLAGVLPKIIQTAKNATAKAKESATKAKNDLKTTGSAVDKTTFNFKDNTSFQNNTESWFTGASNGLLSSTADWFGSQNINSPTVNQSYIDTGGESLGDYNRRTGGIGD